MEFQQFQNAHIGIIHGDANANTYTFYIGDRTFDNKFDFARALCHQIGIDPITSETPLASGSSTSSSEADLFQQFCDVIKQKSNKKGIPIRGSEKTLSFEKGYLNVCLKIKRKEDIEDSYYEYSKGSGNGEDTVSPPSSEENAPSSSQKQSPLMDRDSTEKHDESDVNDDIPDEYKSIFTPEPEADDDIGESTIMGFDEFVQVIEALTTNCGVKNILVSAGGGRGKTTASQRLLFKWASEPQCLDSFKLIIMIVMKLVNCEEGLFENMINQYRVRHDPEFKNRIEELEKALKSNQRKIMWVVDGLDENSSKSKVKEFLENSKGSYPESSFVFLCRPEGKDMMDLTNLVEFNMKDLRDDQIIDFINGFPFSGDETAVTAKRQRLIEKCKTNQIFNSRMKIPLYAVSICSLYDKKKFSFELEDEMDIFSLLFGFSIKCDQEKVIALELQKEGITEEDKKRLSEKRTDLEEMKAEDVVKTSDKLLVALGRAIFCCNKYSMTGYNDLEKKELKKELAKSLSDDEIETVFRLSMYETVYIEEGDRIVTKLQFHLRNARDFLVAFYLAKNTTTLEKDLNPGSLSDSALSVLRCTFSLLQKWKVDAEVLEERISTVLTYLSESYTSDKWRCMQIVAEVLRIIIQEKIYQISSNKLIFKVVSIVKDMNRTLGEELEMEMKEFVPNLLLKLNAKAYSSSCTECTLPKALPTKAKKLFDLKTSGIHNSWPDIKHVVVKKIFSYTEDKICICFPISSCHTNLSSPYIYVKAPLQIQKSSKSTDDESQENFNAQDYYDASSEKTSSSKDPDVKTSVAEGGSGNPENPPDEFIPTILTTLDSQKFLVIPQPSSDAKGAWGLQTPENVFGRDHPLLQHSQHYIRAHSQNPSQPSGSTVGNSPPLASAPHSALHQTSPPTPYAKVESVGQNLPSQDVQNPSLTPLQSTNVPRVQLSGSDPAASAPASVPVPTPLTLVTSTSAPRVVDAQEVYRDPRDKLLEQKANEKARTELGGDPEKLTFKEKMKRFALEAGEAQTLPYKAKASNAQRKLENSGGPAQQ